MEHELLDEYSNCIMLKGHGHDFVKINFSVLNVNNALVRISDGQPKLQSVSGWVISKI